MKTTQPPTFFLGTLYQRIDGKLEVYDAIGADTMRSVYGMCRMLMRAYARAGVECVTTFQYGDTPLFTLVRS